VHIVPATDGDAQILIAPPKHEYTKAAWVSDTQLALVRRTNDGGEIVLLDVTQPDADAKVLTTRCRMDQAYTALVPMPDGKILLATLYGFVAAQDTWDLVKIDLSAEAVTPEVISENPRAGQSAQLMGPGKLLLSDNRPGTVGLPMWIVDLTGGDPTEWRPSVAVVPDTDPPIGLTPEDVTFSPDGARLAFSARTNDEDASLPAANLIWTSAPDGGDVHPVTRWRSALNP